MRLNLPKTVIALGVIGFLINISTTMVYSQLPMYMKNVLGASAFQASTVDGIVEALSHVIRIASGVVSDFFASRKPLLFLGYSLTALSKPLLLVCPSLWVVFMAQSLDRVGNGIIASPRDALIGDVTHTKKRGGSYGFLRSLKTIGSVVGALLGIYVMIITGDQFNWIFIWSIIPVALSLFLLTRYIKEPKEHRSQKKQWFFTKQHLKRLGRPFWGLIALASFFELAHFGETLLSWRANEVGLSQSFMGIVMVIMNVGQFLMAYPLGSLSDRYNRYYFLLAGFFFMILANFFMAFGQSLTLVLVGIFFWGAQMSTTQSLFLSLISEVVPKELRGTAFGIMYFISGIAYLVASEIAGLLWDKFGCVAAFSNSACIAFLSLLGGIMMHRHRCTSV